MMKKEQDTLQSFNPYWLEQGYGSRVQVFQNLMRFRIRSILLVSSLYDLFLFEEDGRYQMALRHYRVALDADPLAADTHVSLALLYEKIGLRRKARAYWQRYLQLEPNGTWVDTARQRLDS